MAKVKIKKIYIHNFISFVDEEWDFDSTSRLILIKGENKDTESPLGNTSNGSGKSAWANALMYALFGQLNGKFHNENIRNDFSDAVKDGFKMSVAVEIDTIMSKTNVRHWRIVRGLQKSKAAVVLQLFVLDDGEWKDISKSSSANTQKFIEDNVLFMNFEMYQRLVMLSIEDKYNFFKLNAGQKRDFVETLFDTSIYSRMYRAMTDDIKTKNMMLQNLKASQMKLGKTKEICEEEIEKWKAGVKDQIAETRTEKEAEEAKIGEFDPKFESLRQAAAVVKGALDRIRENKGKLDAIISQCNDSITNARIDINNYNTTIAHHQRELNKHKEVLGMICEDCRATVSKFYSLDVFKEEIDSSNSQIEEKNAEIENAQKQIEKVRAYDDRLKKEETAKMTELSDVQVQARNLQFQKTQLLNTIRGLERKIQNLIETMEDEQKIPSWSVYQQTMKDIEEVEEELKSEAARLCLLKVGSEIVSPEAIKRNIISRVVASINTMINANLSELCVNFTCELAPDMNDYTIRAGDNEVDLDLRSAGERMKLLISSQLAFRKFLMTRFNVCMNVMIIDEVVDRALDSVSIQKLLGLLLQLSQKENTNIYIISHRGEVEEMFKGIAETQTMVVQKKDNISHILK